MSADFYCPTCKEEFGSVKDAEDHEDRTWHKVDYIGLWRP